MAGPLPRRSQAERRALAERRLIDSAIQLFAEQGFSRTSMAQIGEKAGYSRGLVRERFGSKLGLIAPLLEEIKVRFAELLEPQVEDLTGFDALALFVDRYLAELDRASVGLRAFYGLMGESLSLLPEIQPNFQRHGASYLDAVQRWIEEGLETGEVRADVHPPAAAVLVVSIMRGAAIQWLLGPTESDLQALRKETAASLRGAFVANSGADRSA